MGKKLDFLLQEMNRETNTILSKTNGIGELGLKITDLALAAKGRHREDPRTGPQPRYHDHRLHHLRPFGLREIDPVSGCWSGMPNLTFSISYTTRAAARHGTQRRGLPLHRPATSSRTCLQAANSWNMPRFSGTITAPTAALWTGRVAEGKDLVLDIDVQGARQLKIALPEAVTMFVLPPSRQVLEQRLRARSADCEAVIERRLRGAAEEVRNYTQYDYVLINNELEESVDALAADRTSRADPPDPDGRAGPADSGKL